MRTVSLQNRHAELLLKVLLEPLGGKAFLPYVWDAAQQDLLLNLARKNVVLVRTSERLEELAPCLGRGFRQAAKEEKERIRRTVELIGRVGELCEEAWIEFVFIKAFQHYPDMGHDVDLFVWDRSKKIDTLLRTALGARPARGSLLNRLSGKTSYWVQDYPSPVEIHHARLGHIGEHVAFPRLLTQNRRKVLVGGICTFVPSSEDQLILQTIQRVYGHMSIRLSDIVKSVATMRDTTLDWDYALRTAREIGIYPGLCGYTGYVDDIHRTLFGLGCLPKELRKLLPRHRWGAVHFHAWHYRFPVQWVVPFSYGTKFFAELGRWNLEGVARLSLLPSIAGLVLLQNQCRRLWGIGTAGSRRLKATTPENTHASALPADQATL